MRSVLDDLPKDPAARERFVVALDRFISERSLYLPALDEEQLDAAVELLLNQIATWGDKRPLGKSPPTERLVRRWVRRRIAALREAYKDFRLFVREERSRHPGWNLSHFIGDWFVTREPPAAGEILLLLEVILSKNIEEQESQIGSAVRLVVRRIRALAKASAVLKSEIERRSVSDEEAFWPGLINGLSQAIGQTIGEEAASATAAIFAGAFPPVAAPFLVLLRLRPEWDQIFSRTELLAKATLSAMQENFSSATLVSANAPEKRGVQFRLSALARAGFSQREIADFEGMQPKAVAEHLRRLRRARGGA